MYSVSLQKEQPVQGPSGPVSSPRSKRNWDMSLERWAGLWPCGALQTTLRILVFILKSTQSHWKVASPWLTKNFNELDQSLHLPFSEREPGSQNVRWCDFSLKGSKVCLRPVHLWTHPIHYINCSYLSFTMCQTLWWYTLFIHYHT